MSDLFGEFVPDEFIDRIFAVMALCPQHTFQVLTKRAERMRDYLGGKGLAQERRDHIAIEAMDLRDTLSERHGLLRFTDEQCCIQPDRWPLPNVWLGVSVEDQRRADERIPLLLGTPAAVRWISAEPLLGPLPILYTSWGGKRLDWVVIGGESGPQARPFNIEWARSIIAQCKAADVPCFVKQMGASFYEDRGSTRRRILLDDRKGGGRNGHRISGFANTPPRSAPDGSLPDLRRAGNIS
jgi:protein gp37